MTGLAKLQNVSKVSVENVINSYLIMIFTTNEFTRENV